MSDTPILFTDVYLKDLRRRYSERRSHEQPLVYRIGVSDEHSNVRRDLEDWLRTLPGAESSQLIGNLKGTDSTFIEAYHELAVGALLCSVGLHPRYEADFDRLKPDWSTYATSGAPSLFVEVRTLNKPDQFRKNQSALAELYAGVKRIQCPGVVLAVRFTGHAQCLTRKLVQEAVSKVKTWLLKENPAINAELPINELIFKIARRDDNPKLRCWLPATCFIPNVDRLKNAIKEKIRKYRDVAHRHDAALLIAVVASPLTGLKLRHMSDVLPVLWVENPVCSKGSGEAATLAASRVSGEPFGSLDTALSGILWVWCDAAATWQMKLGLNPLASTPVPSGLFYVDAMSDEGSHLVS